MNDSALIREAILAMEQSYSPYSHFRVGAALLTQDGTVFRGCNIENAAFGPSCCAERTAFFKAVSEGHRTFSAIAVVGAPHDTPLAQAGYAYPCGVCRQVMREFCDPETFRILVGTSETAYIVRTLAQLLPESFGPESL